MAEFIKLYDWILDTGFPLEEKVILALIHQFTEYEGMGYWAGFKAMSARTGIPKVRCKEYVEHLVGLGAVSKEQGTVARKTRVILKTTKQFVDYYRDEYLARE